MPRTGRTWLFLASAVGAIGFGAAALFSAFPQWARLGRVEFDARNASVLKDGWRVARFGEVECVQLTERGLGDEALYIVELRLSGGGSLFLGYTKDQVEAASAAARVSGAVGRPVEVAAG